MQKIPESENERPFAEGCKSMSLYYHTYPQGNVGYTFPRQNPELWYRGKVNADSQGRYVDTTIAATVVGQQKY